MKYQTIKNRSIELAQRLYCRFGFGKKPKVFGIGRNKTGTTSLQHALESLGYRVARTRLGEQRLVDWANGSYQSIISLCRDFDAFQDVPFSLPGCFEVLDRTFPDSKFVLTVRDDEDQWFRSLTRFHAKLFGNGSLPTWKDLESATYFRKGYMAETHRLVYGADKHGLYDERHYKEHYLLHNESARKHFKNRPNDFLELNVGTQGAFKTLCSFLGVESPNNDFPWANRTIRSD